MSSEKNPTKNSLVEIVVRLQEYQPEFATNLLFKENQNKQNVINELMNNGIDAENAKIVVSNLLSSRKERDIKIKNEKSN